MAATRHRPALRALRYVAESPSLALAPKTSSSFGKARTQSPPSRDSSYHRCFGDLLVWVELDRSRDGLPEWIEGAEQEHRSIVEGPNQRPETRAEFRQRIVAEYEGSHPEDGPSARTYRPGWSGLHLECAHPSSRLTQLGALIGGKTLGLAGVDLGLAGPVAKCLV
jgi:hypothetical protein